MGRFSPLLWLAMIGLFFTHGCGGYFPPPPTTRAVVAADLVGQWRYAPMAAGDARVMLTLHADATFSQTVQVGTTTHAHTGTWRVDGADAVFSEILTEFDGWHASPQAWRIIDREGSPSGYAILGGADDPDLWTVFEWVR